MNRVRAIICFTAALTVAVAAMCEEPPPKHYAKRRHFDLVDKKGRLYYHGTAITELTDTLSQTRILMRDVNYGDFVVSRMRSFEDQTTVLSITDKEEKSFVRLTFKWPYTSRTRNATLEEAHLHPELENAPVIVILDTNGGKWEAVETEWQTTDRLHQLRTEVRRSMNPTLLEGIERMRSMALGTDEIAPLAKMVTTYIVHGAEGEINVSLVDATTAPDCDFDKAFGYPCSDRSLERIKKATEQHRQIEEY